jgi:DtxR family Mn-dependent transcriptional regulator
MRPELIEDGLRAIYELQQDQDRATTCNLADSLGVSPASITGLLQQLSEEGLAVYRPYHGAVLTEDGRRRALGILRNHRLIETFLHEKLSLPLERIHREAHRWEHVVTPDVADRLDELLDHPALDPHGAPIPRADGKILVEKRVALSNLQPGQQAIVAEISDRDENRLRYIVAIGLLPRTALRVESRLPFGGPMTISLFSGPHTLGQEITSLVLVRDVTGEPQMIAPDTEPPPSTA